MPLSSDYPVVASFDSEHLTVGAGVAIFHIASSRVVVCYHTTQGYWFLPKGRKDANEETSVAAEREGFEEVCTSLQTVRSFPRYMLISPEWLSEPSPAHRPASSSAPGI